MPQQPTKKNTVKISTIELAQWEGNLAIQGDFMLIENWRELLEPKVAESAAVGSE